MPPTDEEAALQAIATLQSPSTEQKQALAQVNEILHGEVQAPFVDIHELFALYHVLYFRKLLLPRVEVSWSSRLTLCAGICELVKADDGTYSRIRLKLSEPLLKYRPRNDTINTLLHEAIHAYFFITSSWRHSRIDPNDQEADSSHGAGFQLLADAINNHGNYDITIYHTFHEEVDSYRTHIWRCNGRCQQQPPFFGLVKRSMNRPPGKSDPWWQKHQEECGGAFAKISEPELTQTQLKALSAKERAGRQKNKLDSWIKKASKSSKTEDANPGASPGDAVILSKGEKRSNSEIQEAHNAGSAGPSKIRLVTCPICDCPVSEEDINIHLDLEHPP